MFDEVAKKLPGVKVRMGTMDDSVTAIIEENPELPVIKGEMPDTWIHGVMCDPGGIRLSREVHSLLASAEDLNTQLQWWGVKTLSTLSLMHWPMRKYYCIESIHREVLSL